MVSCIEALQALALELNRSFSRHCIDLTIASNTESGASKLETLTAQRNFREAAQAVQATKALQTSFKTFMGVERVATVQRQMTESQQKLKMSAMEEYERL